MSITKSRQIYVGGFEKEYYLDEMSVSHLINTLALIDRNLQTISRIESQDTRKGIVNARKCLEKDMKALTNELAKRKERGFC